MANTITYPLGRAASVTIDPQRQFGQPCVKWRTPTICLYNMFAAGDSIDTIARWYDLTREQTEDGIRYEVMLRCRHGRAAIKRLQSTSATPDSP